MQAILDPVWPDWLRPDEPHAVLKPFQPVPGQPIPPLLQQIPLLATIVALQLPASQLRVWLFVPATFALTVYIVFAGGSDAKASDGVQRGLTATGWAMRMLELLVAWQADKEYKRKGQEESAPPPLTWARLKWTAHLCATSRAIDYEQQPKSIPPGPSISRTRFVLSRLSSVLLWVIVQDAVIALHSYDAFYLSKGTVPRSTVPIVRRLIADLTPGATAIFLLEGLYSALGVVTVLLGIYPTTQWPRLFGPWSATKSLRGFWAVFWHQSLRRQLLAVARLTEGFNPGFSKRHWTLLAAFFTSALVHVSQNYACSHYWARSLLFFVLQPIALVAEEKLGPRLRKAGLPSWLGYFWVLAWLTWTSPLLWHDIAKSGLYNEALFGTFAIFPRSQAYLRGNGWL